MIGSLIIKNYALIENLNINFKKGFNVITGETGAGKSIIIDALSLLFGENLDVTFIKDLSRMVYIEAEFFINNLELLNILKENGIEESDEKKYIIKRIYEPQTRKNIYKINDISVTKELLKEVTNNLVDLIGQHEHQNLLNVKNHIFLLDSFAKIENEVSEFKLLFNNYKIKNEKYNNLLNKKEEQKRRRDYLEFAINEIENSKLSLEDENIYQKRKEISNIEKIANILSELHDLISGEDAFLSKFGKIRKNINSYSNLSEELKLINDLYEESYIRLEELSESCIAYLEKIDYSENYVKKLDERIDIIEKLKIKYGKTIEEVLKFKENSIKELEEITNIDEEIEILKKDIDTIKNELINLAKSISAKRRVWAKNLEVSIENYLEKIGMSKTKFSVYIYYQEDQEGLVEIDKKRYKIHENGLDYVEFCISTNIGEQLKPLRKIASGGELSRIMLAIKLSLSNVDKISTFIFDEIDVGIGGETANLIGKQIKELSEKKQIICITHLPQIARFADNHFFVEKKVEDNKTNIYVYELEGESKINEIARMLSGTGSPKEAYEHAKSLIIEAQKNR
ncbi:MAG: DNA repair protein RecN [Spirochaetes bacterium]|nr:DNA repair protein RecN [Spirochaetota bacterium]